MIFKKIIKDKTQKRPTLEDNFSNFDSPYHSIKQPHDPLPFLTYTTIGVAILFKTGEYIYNNLTEIANITNALTNPFYQTIEWFVS